MRADNNAMRFRGRSHTGLAFAGRKEPGLTPFVTRCAAIVAMLISVVATAGAEENRWRKLPLPSGRPERASSLAIEGNNLWTMAGNTVAYWDGKEWHQPTTPKLRAGMYLARLEGGGDRPLFCTQPGQRDHWGEIYQLKDTEARFVTEFRYDVAHRAPGIYVSRSGNIFNFSEGRLAVFDGVDWVEREAPDAAPVIVDAQESVYFYYPVAQQVVEIDRENRFKESTVPLEFAEQRPKVIGVHWGDDRVLLFAHGRPGLYGFRLEDGQAIDVSDLNEKIKNAVVFDAFRTRDGSVWILVRGFRLYRIYPDGIAELIENLVGVDWSKHQFWRHPKSVLESESGNLWFGGIGHPVTCYDKTAIRRFDFRTGYDLKACSHLVEDRCGTIYAANSSGIYAYFATTAPPSNLPPPREPAQTEQQTWIYQPADRRSTATAAWRYGTKIFTTSREQEISAIDATTGRLLYRRKLGAASTGSMLWMLGKTDEGILHVATHSEIVHVRADDSEIIDRVTLDHDPRIGPVSVASGYLAVPTPRGSQFACISEQGNTHWQIDLPGYVMMHPAIQGRFALLQTRRGSYGGQQTVCVDTSSGTLLWKDRTDAYGRGAAFDDNATFVVEANIALSPETSDGWLIGRRLPDGERLWEYRQTGGMHHPPLVDGEHGRVFAVFSRGQVVCLRNEDGSVVWQQTLPETAFAGGSANSYYPAWSPHTLEGSRLHVLDQNLVLHVLSSDTGEFLASVALQDGDPLAARKKSKLVAAPWITEDAIISAFEDRVVACELPDELYRQESPPEPPRLARACPSNAAWFAKSLRSRSTKCRGAWLLDRSCKTKHSVCGNLLNRLKNGRGSPSFYSSP